MYGLGYYYPYYNCTTALISSSYDASYPASSTGGQAVYDGQSYPSPNYDAYQYQGEYGNQQAMPQPPYQGGYTSYDENGNAYMQQKILLLEISMEALINLIIKAMHPEKASMNNKLPLKLILRSMSKEVS